MVNTAIPTKHRGIGIGVTIVGGGGLEGEARVPLNANSHNRFLLF